MPVLHFLKGFTQVLHWLTLLLFLTATSVLLWLIVKWNIVGVLIVCVWDNLLYLLLDSRVVRARGIWLGITESQSTTLASLRNFSLVPVFIDNYVWFWSQRMVLFSWSSSSLGNFTFSNHRIWLRWFSVFVALIKQRAVVMQLIHALVCSLVLFMIRIVHPISILSLGWISLSLWLVLCIRQDQPLLHIVLTDVEVAPLLVLILATTVTKSTVTTNIW